MASSGIESYLDPKRTKKSSSMVRWWLYFLFGYFQPTWYHFPRGEWRERNINSIINTIISYAFFFFCAPFDILDNRWFENSYRVEKEWKVFKKCIAHDRVNKLIKLFKYVVIHIVLCRQQNHSVILQHRYSCFLLV